MQRVCRMSSAGHHLCWTLSRVTTMRQATSGVTVVMTLLMAGCGGFHIGETASAGQRDLQTAVQRALQERNRPAYVTRDREGTRLWKLTRTFYGRRAFAPAWI